MDGEAGVGKTSSAKAALSTAGAPVHVGGGLATLAWKPWLALERAIGPGVPEGDTAWVGRWLADAVGDGILFLDDAQWPNARTRSVVPLFAESVGLVLTVVERTAQAARVAEAQAQLIHVPPAPRPEGALSHRWDAPIAAPPLPHRGDRAYRRIAAATPRGSAFRRIAAATPRS